MQDALREARRESVSLGCAAAVPLEVVEKPKRRTLDEVPLMQTYTSKEGQLFVCRRNSSVKGINSELFKKK